MARPTADEIAEFEARMNEPENNPEDDFEIEIFTPEGHGARLPYSRGRAYLQQHFGIDLDEKPGAENAANPPKSTKRTRNSTDGNSVENPEDSMNVDNVSPMRPTSRYFGKRPAS